MVAGEVPRSDCFSSSNGGSKVRWSEGLQGGLPSGPDSLAGRASRLTMECHGVWWAVVVFRLFESEVSAVSLMV